MIIWLRDGKAFQSAVITRFLYYSTGLEGIDLYVSGLKKIGPFVRYSKIPIRVIKERVKFDIPNGDFLLVHPKGKRLEEVDIKNYDGFLVDFSGRLEGEAVRSLGISLLHYEAISLFARLFLIEKNKVEIDLKEEDIRDKLYFARKILDGIEFMDNYYIISPRLLVFSLKNFEKKYKILVDLEKTEIELSDKLVERIYIKFYDYKLNEIDRDIIVLEENYLEIPVLIGKNKKRFRFYIDFDRRMVSVSNNLYISKRDLSKESSYLGYLQYF